MSGIVGVLNLDGSPADPQLLQKLTEFMAQRGPDAQRTWIEGSIGFGHALLITSEADEGDCQPRSLDGDVWIVADARIDARRELIDCLQAKGQEPSCGATDAELILLAYNSWGEDCVKHLLGDFAFGICDQRRKSVFCARDQMGVKPFYYAHLGPVVIFSNTLGCIRRHPAVSDNLNELAIADFLLSESNRNPATTSFADIQRLPPGHRVTWSSAGGRIDRYWTMPVDEPVFYRRPDDYIDRFQELIREAVSDRLRTNRLGIFMSGGLDSTALAATSLAVLKESRKSFDLRAFTMLGDFPPDERHYAGLAAEHLGIPIDFRDWSAESMDSNWEQIAFSTPEPNAAPWQLLALQNYLREISGGRRVFFAGEGPDNALSFEWRPYVAYLAARKRYARLARDLFATLIADRRIPFWGRVSKYLEGPSSGEDSAVTCYPTWLNPDFESRLELRARWAQNRQPSTSDHLLRPDGYASTQITLWQVFFEGCDAERTGVPCEIRHPYVDLRVLKFLLSVPALPWCRSKYLIRRAMHNSLPKQLLQRRKTGVPTPKLMKKFERAGLPPLNPAPRLESYVQVARLPPYFDSNTGNTRSYLCARSLNHWLHYSRTIGHNALRQEDSHGQSRESIGSGV